MVPFFQPAPCTQGSCMPELGPPESTPQGASGKDLKDYFNPDGLGAIVNSSRGIIAAYKKEEYAKFGAENFADASRQAVQDMIEDLKQAMV